MSAYLVLAVQTADANEIC